MGRPHARPRRCARRQGLVCWPGRQLHRQPRSATGAQKKYTIEEGTNPHTLIVDEKGTVWSPETGTVASGGSIQRPAP